MLIPDGPGRPPIRIIHSLNSTEDLLFRANENLASGKAKDALSLYTQVLYSNCPGHPFALLLRAITYTRLGYPELAVTDGYRAALSGREMRDSTSRAAYSKICTCCAYLRAEEHHRIIKAEWTSHISEDQAKPLAWLTFHIFVPPTPHLLDFKLRAQVACLIEYRAMYLMARALQKCGGGALRDALGLISDSDQFPDIPAEYKMCMHQLGGDIMKEIESEFQRGEARSADSMPLDNITMKDQMQSRSTLIKRVVYPWNDKEIDFSDPSAFPLNVEGSISNCAIVCQDKDRGMTPCLELQATQDIFLEKVTVVAERPAFVVNSDQIHPLGIKPADPPIAGVHICSPRSLYNHPIVQALLNRILCGFLESAVNRNQHPLEDEAIRSLNGAAQDYPASDQFSTRQQQKFQPWSYLNNVVCPISGVKSCLESKGLNQFQRLEHLDGWVINTLLAKILNNTRVRTGHRYGNPAAEKVQSAPNAEMTMHQPSGPNDTWVASISPIFNMIRLADEFKGETPNVQVSDEDLVVCHIVPGDLDPPIVRRGELLLRAPDPFPMSGLGCAFPEYYFSDPTNNDNDKRNSLVKDYPEPISLEDRHCKE
ncbi:hypothetical protein MMC31_005007 [Peltigera leucophlebia]|nr:hypothetical protein [Peltigera leucophlebia]